MSDTISRRDAFYVLDICHFASEAEKNYAYSLMEQVESADDKDTNDTISRQAAIDAINDRLETVISNIHQRKVVQARIKDVIKRLPSAQPYSGAEIQTMQDLEQAELDKAFELGKEEGRKDGDRHLDAVQT